MAIRGVMNKRRKLVIALGYAFVAPLGSFAQPMVGTYRVGTLTTVLARAGCSLECLLPDIARSGIH
jgi:hypothetical protein